MGKKCYDAIFPSGYRPQLWRSMLLNHDHIRRNSVWSDALDMPSGGGAAANWMPLLIAAGPPVGLGISRSLTLRVALPLALALLWRHPFWNHSMEANA